MRVNLTLNNACQPLRNNSFGKSAESHKNSPSSNPNFSSDTVSKKDYDKLNAKFDLACRIACQQAQQYNELLAKTGYNCKDCK